MEKNFDRLIRDAESKIQRILLDLDEDLLENRSCIDEVDVDTREFSNMRVSIQTDPRRTK